MKKICNRCVMDSDCPDISFDSCGNCNYCSEFVRKIDTLVEPDPVVRDVNLTNLVEKVKREGKGRPYDCVIGLSGGVDSAWALFKAKELGLRPLAVHMDNGWNSELAQSNIESLVNKLGVDLYTYVIDWNEYRDLMEAFFAADVVDVELLYDNAMFSVNYKMAAKYGLRWILAGTNSSTEGMKMPDDWYWYKFDARNIKAIASSKKIRIKSFPCIGGGSRWYYERFKSIKWISFLDLLDYKKKVALLRLKEECGYREYPYKHYESVFTRFYQGYILPNKFGIDKRKVHLSTLIVTKQASRDECLDLLAQIPYPNENDLESDREYFLKKMGWKSEKLNSYINREPRSHTDFASEAGLRRSLRRALSLGRR